MQRPLHQRHAAAYRQVNVETLVHGASPHQLVALLFDELMRNLTSARSALTRGDMTTKGAAIGKCVRVLEEGLKAGLNAQAGGTLAASLRTLYDGIIMRLTLANLRNDDMLLDEAQRLIHPIQDAWQEIGRKLPTPTPIHH